MKTLHIVRKTNDPLAQEAIAQDRQAAVLLIQDGVFAKGPFPSETYACREDLTARGIASPHPAVDYAEIARLIAEHDRVITW
ncbi:MAG: sulfurtransferase TusB [Nitrospirae bacterium]|nr:sulfurtransferase TusB [Candidatus Manganitrophaceae bacterium]